MQLSGLHLFKNFTHHEYGGGGEGGGFAGPPFQYLRNREHIFCCIVFEHEINRAKL